MHYFQMSQIFMKIVLIVLVMNLIIKNKILELKRKIEKHYKVQFNFNDKFLYYPKYKDDEKKYKF